jgi:transcription elongation GreA/GreB family factor
MNALRHDLQSLHTVRKAEPEAAIKEVAALLKLSEMKGLEYDPARAAQAQVRRAVNSGQNGFGFANDQIPPRHRPRAA